MVTKLGKMMTYTKGLLPIKLLDPLLMWSCEITQQTKTIISPDNKLKQLCLHYHNAYDQQTWQDGDLP